MLTATLLLQLLIWGALYVEFDGVWSSAFSDTLDSCKKPYKILLRKEPWNSKMKFESY